MILTDKEVEDIIKELAGNHAVSLVMLIKDKENVSEFKLAEKLNLTVNQVRTILYELSAHNLVKFTRKKDKKKGWYIYFWTFDERRARELVVQSMKRKLEILESRLGLEKTGTFFACPGGCIRMTYENAMEVNFVCPECGKILVEKKSQRDAEVIRKDIEAIKNEIDRLSTPIVEEPVKVIKKRKKLKKKSKKKLKKKIKKLKRKIRKLKKKIKRLKREKRKIKKQRTKFKNRYGFNKNKKLMKKYFNKKFKRR
ncbi:MAG: hypothetical protein HYS32_00970 [Candidatus Woesearchaeota archaeon]|nr:MAG: hypothetical protein HYS32_00970 [Candidatus Woesearchaeota archaeon]